MTAAILTDIVECTLQGECFYVVFLIFRIFSLFRIIMSSGFTRSIDPRHLGNIELKLDYSWLEVRTENVVEFKYSVYIYFSCFKLYKQVPQKKNYESLLRVIIIYILLASDFLIVSCDFKHWLARLFWSSWLV